MQHLQDQGILTPIQYSELLLPWWSKMVTFVCMKTISWL